jgi:quercetin dioxygenase-like cupin family protein
VAVVKVDVGAGDFAIFESGPPPGHGQPPHVHDEYDEAFHVLAGEVLFRVGDEEMAALAGATVFAPRGSVHGFRNVTAEAARMLVIATPGALELVEGLGRIVSGGVPDPAAISEAFASHRSRVIPAGSGPG